jgi:hypothetical protein
MIDGAGLLALILAAVGFGFVLMSDLGGWAWLRRRIRLPGWIRRRLHIPPARPWQRAEASARTVY